MVAEILIGSELILEMPKFLVVVLSFRTLTVPVEPTRKLNLSSGLTAENVTNFANFSASIAPGLKSKIKFITRMNCLKIINLKKKNCFLTWVDLKVSQLTQRV